LQNFFKSNKELNINLQEKASFWDRCRKFILYLDDRGIYREHVLLMNSHVRRKSSFNVDK